MPPAAGGRGKGNPLKRAFPFPFPRTPIPFPFLNFLCRFAGWERMFSDFSSTDLSSPFVPLPRNCPFLDPPHARMRIQKV
jgi:hypothetical protein